MATENKNEGRRSKQSKEGEQQQQQRRSKGTWYHISNTIYSYDDTIDIYHLPPCFRPRFNVRYNDAFSSNSAFLFPLQLLTINVLFTECLLYPRSFRTLCIYLVQFDTGDMNTSTNWGERAYTLHRSYDFTSEFSFVFILFFKSFLFLLLLWVDNDFCVCAVAS